MSGVLTLRVQRVRSRSSKGTTASCIAIDPEGRATPDAARYAVAFPSRITPVEVLQGQWWRVAGDAELVQYVVDGYQVQENRLTAQTAGLLRPSGEHIVQLLSTSPGFPGIGEVKARRLWEALGDRLYNCLEEADDATLGTVVGPDLAAVLISGWQQYGAADALQWFQEVGIELRLSRKVLAVYGRRAHVKVKEDPFRLLAFGMSWSAADTLARQHFGLPLDAPQRLSAAVENVLYNAFDGGDTFCERSEVEARLRRLIAPSHVPKALTLAESDGVVGVRGNRLHAHGPYLIEQSVAEALNQRIGASLPLAGREDVDALLVSFEKEEAAATVRVDFTLNAAQREAVHAAALNPLLLITGGAGVGKTTVLKAVVYVLDQCDRTTYLMALSGRAAKRMAEATKRPAMTIAGFLRNVAPGGLPENSVLVVDEASMLDVLLAYRLLKAIPASCRIILIGDPFQLPPVGPGLTLHALVPVRRVPRVELTEVRRFGGDIARGAQELRDGRWPTFSAGPQPALAFIPCATGHIPEMVLRQYLADPKGTQILTFTRERGVASARILNELCQEAVGGDAPRLLVWNEDRSRQEDSGLRLGDPVLCVRNLWDLGLQNGSLGRLETIEETPQPRFNAEGERTGDVLAWVRWDDGELRPVTEEVLDALELGYALTVHKAQGSQFSRIIVPVSATQHLDRTMVYTAVTRATTQVLLIGDAEAGRRAVEAPPHASQRKVALADLLGEAC